MKQSPAQLLKQELMERYNLEESQVNIKLEIKDVDLDLGIDIAYDFDKYKSQSNPPYFTVNEDLEVVLGKEIKQVAIFLKEDKENADSWPF